jgi:hypothetical protein
MTATIVHNLSPLNDLARTAYLEMVDNDGAVVPRTTGPIAAFIASSNSPTATAVDETLSVTGTHVGSSDEGALYPEGTWLFEFDGDSLTAEILQPIFAPASGAAPVPYVIVTGPGLRVVEKLKYLPARAAVIA